MNTTTERPAPAKHDYDRIPYLVAYQNNSAVRDVYGGIAELVVLESYLLKPRHRASDTVLVFMHPIGGGAYLPMINALARAGHHVIYCNSRFRGTDSALLMEKVVEDLGECIRDAKERLGYTKVVLAGWSGGGSLSAFYQQQAQRPTVTASPSGDGPDLTQLGLIPADGIMLLAAHISRHGTMTEWLDASILDETDPTRRDPELDLYDPANPNQPPYTAEFLERYRSAQIARNRRITRWVKDKLTELRAAGRPQLVDHGFVAGHGERGQHQVGFQCQHGRYVQLQVAPQLRQRLHHRGRKVGVGIHPHQPVCAAERADNLGVGGGVADQAHGWGMPWRREPRFV